MKLNQHAAKGKGQLTFAEAKFPIVAFEGRVPFDGLDKNPRSKKSNIENRPSIPLMTIDLTKIDVFGPKFKGQFQLSYSQLRWERMSKAYPKGWDRAIVTAYVCEDTNGDGQCSDETEAMQMVAGGGARFEACKLPSAIVMNIYFE